MADKAGIPVIHTSAVSQDQVDRTKTVVEAQALARICPLSKKSFLGKPAEVSISFGHRTMFEEVTQLVVSIVGIADVRREPFDPPCQ